MFALAAPLNFTNASYVDRRLEEMLHAANAPVHLLVLEASGMIDIDYTGSRILQQTIARLRGAGVTVALARLLGERAQVQAERTGLIGALESDHVFRTVDDAVRTLRSEMESSD